MPRRASGSQLLPPTAVLGSGASTAMSADGSPLPLRLWVLFRGFAALWALKKSVWGADSLRTSRTNVNITSLILATGRVFEGETSLRALHTRCVCPWGMNSTQVIGEEGVLRCTNAMKETSQPLSRCQQERKVRRQSSSVEGGERLGCRGAAEEGTVGAEAITLDPMVVVEVKERMLSC